MFPTIRIDRGISETTGKRIIDEFAMFHFREDDGDTLLHARFIAKYKYKPNETTNTKTSKD